MNKTAARQNIGFPRGLQPFSRHATTTIITGPTFNTKKRLCSFIDDFPLNDYPVSLHNLLSSPLVAGSSKRIPINGSFHPCFLISARHATTPASNKRHIEEPLNKGHYNKLTNVLENFSNVLQTFAHRPASAVSQKRQKVDRWLSCLGDKMEEMPDDVRMMRIL